MRARPPRGRREGGGAGERRLSQRGSEPARTLWQAGRSAHGAPKRPGAGWGEGGGGENRRGGGGPARPGPARPGPVRPGQALLGSAIKLGRLSIVVSVSLACLSLAQGALRLLRYCRRSGSFGAAGWAHSAQELANWDSKMRNVCADKEVSMGTRNSSCDISNYSLYFGKIQLLNFPVTLKLANTLFRNVSACCISH